MKSMLGSAIAVGTALLLSARHQASLRISLKERRRYWSKSANLALCYWGFVYENNSTSARRAGEAAFYCCAYDVITDWRNYDKKLYAWFKDLLNKEVSPGLAQIVFRLYEEEQKSTLRFDGLSRGIDALDFVTGLIGSRKYFQDNLDFERVGIVMQIVDDVLDWKDDLRTGDTNCLLVSPEKRIQYLQTLLAFNVVGFKAILPQANVLCAVIRSAQKKALRMLPNMLSESSRVPEPL